MTWIYLLTWLFQLIPTRANDVQPQAGQVMFHDTSCKVAQSRSDFDKEGLSVMIFANRRGFSGGSRDMAGKILEFGVDFLREYTNPVYLPFSPRRTSQKIVGCGWSHHQRGEDGDVRWSRYSWWYLWSCWYSWRAVIRPKLVPSRSRLSLAKSNWGRSTCKLPPSLLIWTTRLAAWKKGVIKDAFSWSNRASSISGDSSNGIGRCCRPDDVI